MNEGLARLLQRAVDLQGEGRRVIGCLLVNARGSTPQSAGALMLVDDRMETYGTIGGGCVEAELRREAFTLLQNGASRRVDFKLDHDYGWDDGMLCGGTLEMAVGPLPPVERLQEIVEAIEHRRGTELTIDVDTDSGVEPYTLDIPPRERLYIAGAGHIGQAVARISLRMEFDVTLFDDRSDMLERYAPQGAMTASGEIAGALADAPIDDATYCVIVTRGHRHDASALAAVLNRGARYIGMIGSRRKVKLTYDALEERGFDRSVLEQLHAPIGLRIGSVLVEEIAVSIMAEIVQVRRAAKPVAT